MFDFCSSSVFVPKIISVCITDMPTIFSCLNLLNVNKNIAVAAAQARNPDVYRKDRNPKRPRGAKTSQLVRSEKLSKEILKVCMSGHWK